MALYAVRESPFQKDEKVVGWLVNLSSCIQLAEEWKGFQNKHFL